MGFPLYRTTALPLSKKNTFLFILLLVFCIFIATKQVLQMFNKSLNTRPNRPWDIGRNNVFHLVGGTHALAFSAYFDTSTEDHVFVRVFALAPRDKSYIHISCKLLYRGLPNIVHISSKVEMLSSHFGFMYTVCNFICDAPKHLPTPSHVTLVDGSSHLGEHFLIPVYAPSNSSRKHTFGVCLPTLFGEFNNSLLFIQSVEMYRILGVGIVTVYNTSVSPTMEKVLKHYAQTGFIDIVQWPIEHHLNPSKGWIPTVNPGDIHYYGQMATINDCLYRNMYRVKYLAVNDIDEIILPRRWSNWASMMEALEEDEVAAYYFRMHTFPVNETYTWNMGPGMELRGTDILKQTVKLVPPIHSADTPTKVLLCPTRVVYHAVHGVLTFHSGFTRKDVPDSDATVQHYKAWDKKWQFPRSSELEYDNSTLKHSQLLAERVSMIGSSIQGLL